MLQSTELSAGKAGSRRGTRPRGRTLLMIAGLIMTVMVASAAPGHAGSKDPRSPKYWKGKNISEASKKFGDPTQMTPLPDTGGTLYIFAHHGEQHWVFETEAGGRIIKAAKVE